MAEIKKNIARILQLPNLVPEYGLQYALNTASIGSHVLQMSTTQDDQLSTNSDEYIDIHHNIQTAINLINEILKYSRLEYVQSKVSIKGVFKDTTLIIDILQQCQETSEEIKNIQRGFLIKLNKAITAISKVRESARELGKKFERSSKISEKKLIEISEQIDCDLNSINAQLQQLISRK